MRMQHKCGQQVIEILGEILIGKGAICQNTLKNETACLPMQCITVAPPQFA